MRQSGTSAVGVPRSLLRRLWYALAGAGLFVGVATVEGALRPDYNAWHQAISALSLGARGWVQQINFVLLGAVLISTVSVWRRILTGGKGANAYPALTAVIGLSFIAVAFLPQDPAPGYDPAGLGLVKPTTIGLLHLAVAGVAVACSVAALFVMAARVAGDPHWRGWSLYTRGTAVVMIACVVVYGVWSTQSTGLAGTFERIAVIIPPLWAVGFIRRLWAGVPFMVESKR